MSFSKYEGETYFKCGNRYNYKRIINVSKTKESGELPTLVVSVSNADNTSPKPTEVVCRHMGTSYCRWTTVQELNITTLTLHTYSINYMNKHPHGLQHAKKPLKIFGSYPVSMMHTADKTYVQFIRCFQEKYCVQKVFPQVALLVLTILQHPKG